MARLIYSAITSLDGYIADETGNFDWAEPNTEVHAFVNERERPIGTYLYGRQMYEVMRVWETMDPGPDEPAGTRDYAALWRAADKVVYSRSLDVASTPRTLLERSFDTDAVRRMKADSARDLSVGGPGLAGHALAAGLVDEICLYLNPVVIGGGTPSLPDGVRCRLELLDEHRFRNGVVYVQYSVDA